MSKKNEPAADQQMENIENALTQAESFVLKNQKILTNIVLAVLIIAVAIVAIHRYYVLPRQNEAAVQLYPAERYFAADSLGYALNGDGNNLGFIDIINEYGSTPSGKLANYYAGICNLRMGNYQEAINYLKKFKSKDVMVSTIAIGAMGDAYAELGKNAEAISSYLKAAANKPNEETSPIYLFRAGLLCEKTGDLNQALALYEKIQSEYPSSTEGGNIEKYIARVKQAK